MNLTRRDFAATATPDGTNGLKGVAIPFGVLSGPIGEYGKVFKEIIAPGAADSSLAKNDIVALVAHDWKRPVARTSSKSLVLNASQGGLDFQIKSLPDASWARDLGKQVGAGLIVACSFGFRVLDDKFEMVGNQLTRTIFEFDLREISFVILPAYEKGTSVTLAQPVAPSRLMKSRAMFHFLKAKHRAGNRLVTA